MTKVNVNAVSAEFARNYLTSNPNATEQNLQVSLKNHLQSLKRNGAKISDKQIAQANANVGELYKATAQQIKANTVVNVTPNTSSAVKTLNTQQAKVSYPKPKAHLAADHHYFEFNKMGRKARRNLHKENMHDARAAFGGDDYLKFLKEHNPKLYEEEIAKQVKQVSNNQNKKVANAGYQSAKKRKAVKNRAEIISQNTHNSYRNTKNLRNKRYCTSQGIMTKSAKRKFRIVNNRLDGNIHVSINETANPTLQKMKQFYQSLEQANIPNVAPKSGLPKPVVANPVPPKSVSQPIKTAVETAVDTAKKGKLGWIVGIGAGLAALVGIAATSKKEVPQEALNRVA